VPQQQPRHTVTVQPVAVGRERFDTGSPSERVPERYVPVDAHVPPLGGCVMQDAFLTVWCRTHIRGP